MARYWLVNTSTYPTEDIKKVIDRFNPHCVDFNIYCTNDLVRFKRLASIVGYPAEGSFISADAKKKRALICIYEDLETKFPRASSKDFKYRRVAHIPNARYAFFNALVHEIKHLDNYVMPLLKAKVWSKKTIERIGRKAEYDSMRYSRDKMKTVWRLIEK